jgi:hypothetical protein
MQIYEDICELILAQLWDLHAHTWAKDNHEYRPDTHRAPFMQYSLISKMWTGSAQLYIYRSICIQYDGHFESVRAGLTHPCPRSSITRLCPYARCPTVPQSQPSCHSSQRFASYHSTLSPANPAESANWARRAGPMDTHSEEKNCVTLLALLPAFVHCRYPSGSVVPNPRSSLSSSTYFPHPPFHSVPSRPPKTCPLTLNSKTRGKPYEWTSRATSTGHSTSTYATRPFPSCGRMGPKSTLYAFTRKAIPNRPLASYGLPSQPSVSS